MTVPRKRKSTSVAVLDADNVLHLAEGSSDGSGGTATSGGEFFPSHPDGAVEAPLENGLTEKPLSRQPAEEHLHASEDRLRKQNAALADLTRIRRQHRGNLRGALRGITEAAARALGIERAGIWLFNEDRLKIRCLNLYEQSLDFHSEGVELTAGNYPAYFRTLEEEFTIAAHYARTDPRTREFTDDYLGPLGITSMLDVAIRLGGKLVGMVCHEHVGPPRRWMLEEQNFASAIAELAGLAIEESELERAESALRESETRFASFMNNTLALAWMKDSSFRYVYINQPYERLYGRSLKELADKDDFELWPMEIARELRANDEMVLRSGEPLQTFEMVPGLDGQPCYWLVFKFPFQDGSGERFVGGMGVDITGRRSAEEALLESENLLRTIIEAEPECVKLVSADGRLLKMNRAGLNMIEADTFLQVAGKPVVQIVASEHRPAFESLLKAVFKGESRKLKFEIVGFKGTRRWLETHGVPLRNHKGEITAMLSVTRDVTEQKRAEESLRGLSRRILEAQEAERRRVARELHDSVNQLLASVRFRVQSIREKISGKEKWIACEAAKATELLERALQEVRRISRNLRPSELDDLGLLPAVRSLCEEFQRRTGLLVDLHCSRLPRRFSSEVELTLYRIIQEALNNVEKHAQAHHVFVQLVRDGSLIKLSVKDDGQGLRVATAKSRKKKAGFGLVNMRERAAFVGSALELISSPRGGTEIVVKVPSSAIIERGVR